MIELHPGEKLLAVERRHWLPIILETVSLFFAGLVPLFFLLAAPGFLSFETQNALAGYWDFIWFGYAAWLLVLWMAIGMFVTDYYLDMLLITSDRIIDAEQLGLFSRDVAELRLENIQDVRAETPGILPSLLNYGNLYIQSSGENREFSLKQMHSPQRIREIISKAHDAARRGPAAQEERGPAPGA